MTTNKNEKILYYNSPRWSSEICDCSMPLSLDTYSSCSFDCLYCFAFFRKKNFVIGYKGVNDSHQRNSRPVNINQIKQIFMEAEKGEYSNGRNKQFSKYIQNKLTLQWGGMSDPFDENEEEQEVSLELLKFFDKIDYPLSISTKGTFFTEDKRYMDLIRKHPHNWHFKYSIITSDEEKAALIERGVPSPNERFKAMKRLTDLGVNVTLRLRPYIIGLSDDYPTTIKLAHQNGANSVSTEFFYLKPGHTLLPKYDEISSILGFDIYKFYDKYSAGLGYKRLNYSIKKDIVNNMRELTHKYGMKFYVSDAHHKEKSDGTCCCGCPESFNIFRGQFAEALQIAKKRDSHLVYWSDISSENEEIVGDFKWERAEGYNTNNARTRALRYRQSMTDFIRERWNDPENVNSPFKYFDGILYPVGLDDNNDVIYKYNYEKGEV